jgi:hypothetical protein
MLFALTLNGMVVTLLELLMVVVLAEMLLDLGCMSLMLFLVSYWQNKSFAVSQKLDSSSSQRGKFNFFTSGGPSTGTGTILWTLECTSGGVWTLIATNTSLSTTYGTGIYLTHLCSAPDTIAFSIDIGYGTVWEASILWFFKTL